MDVAGKGEKGIIMTWISDLGNGQVDGRPTWGDVAIDYRDVCGEDTDTEEREQKHWDWIRQTREKGESKRRQIILDRSLKTCKEQAEEVKATETKRRECTFNG